MKMAMKSLKLWDLYTVKDWVKLSLKPMRTGSLALSQVPQKEQIIAMKNITAKIIAQVKYWEELVFSVMRRVGIRPAKMAPREEKTRRTPEKLERMV